MSTLAEWMADLDKAADEVVAKTTPVMKKAAQNIKDEVRVRWDGMRHAPYLAAAVTYSDPVVEGTRVSLEVGPDKDLPQGALGNLLEYGSVNNAPRPALGPAADEEEPRLGQALEDVAAGLLDD